MTSKTVSLVVFVEPNDSTWIDRASEIGEAEGHVATELRTIGTRLACVVRFEPNTPAAARARVVFDSTSRR